ncbi:MAG: hypothetical protein LBP76_14110 [Treponema sp.]|jgi:hypothetical protein|nr:hypothetical protein [Treponema sp.]
MLVFWGAAIFGSLFFVLRVILFVVGGFGADIPDDDLSPGDEPAGTDASEDLGTSEGAFKLLSLNSITGFIAMFGWAGLAAYSQYGLPFPAALLIAGLAGFFVLVITAALFYFAMKLKSPGAEFDITGALGAAAEVYLQIVPPKTGRVSFTVNGIRHEADAVSGDGKPIGSFEKVRITGVIDPHTVAVEPYNGEGRHGL